jgi:hypothetical protein
MSDAQDKSVQKMMQQFCEHCGNEAGVGEHVYCQDAHAAGKQEGIEAAAKLVEALRQPSPAATLYSQLSAREVGERIRALLQTGALAASQAPRKDGET